MVEFAPHVHHPVPNRPVVPYVAQALFFLIMDELFCVFVLNAPHRMQELLDEPVVVLLEGSYSQQLRVQFTEEVRPCCPEDVVDLL